jgi:MraZ protein
VEKPDAQPASSTKIEAPRGFHSARVDDKGRLKLPAAIADYLVAQGDPRVFITTVDGITARIYPISVWEQNESLLEERGEDTGLKNEISFIADHFGADSDIDAQGRVLMPTELRRALRMEGEQVHLRCFKQRIEVISKEVYEQRLAKAMAGLDQKVQSLEQKGLR